MEIMIVVLAQQTINVKYSMFQIIELYNQFLLNKNFFKNYIL